MKFLPLELPTCFGTQTSPICRLGEVGAGKSWAVRFNALAISYFEALSKTTHSWPIHTHYQRRLTLSPKVTFHTTKRKRALINQTFNLKPCERLKRCFACFTHPTPPAAPLPGAKSSCLGTRSLTRNNFESPLEQTKNKRNYFVSLPPKVVSLDEWEVSPNPPETRGASTPLVHLSSNLAGHIEFKCRNQRS